jgi:hypothetical protein
MLSIRREDTFQSVYFAALIHAAGDVCLTMPRHYFLR